MFKLCFYVPKTDLETVKAAIFAAGAGRIGDYDQCAWQCDGEGQYRPLEGSNPTLGTHHKVHHVAEYKVETVCQDEYVQTVIEALCEAHPYEEPAYQVWQLADYKSLGGTF